MWKRYALKAIVIGVGPSLEKYDQLKTIAKSNFKGVILMTDSALKMAMKAGILPDKFMCYVCTSEDDYRCFGLYEDKLVKQYADKLTVFLVSPHDYLIEYLQDLDMKIHLFKDDTTTGILAGVGNICWYYAWNQLKCDTIGLVGFDMGYEKGYENNFPEQYRDIFLKVSYNPALKCEYVVDPIYDYFRKTLIEYVEKTNVKTINLTPQGSLYHESIQNQTLEEFLNDDC